MTQDPTSCPVGEYLNCDANGCYCVPAPMDTSLSYNSTDSTMGTDGTMAGGVMSQN